MKALIALLAMGLVACVQGQDVCADAIAKIPDCARTCIRDASTDVGCEQGDLKCSCDPAKQAEISSAAIGCVLQACGVEKGLQVSSAGAEVCSCAATAVPAAASSAPAAASTTPAVEPEPSATPESSAPPAPPATSKAPAPPKGSSYVSPTPPFPTAASTRSAGAATAPSGTAPSASATKSSFAPSFTGAAVHAVGSVGGALGALFFALWAI